MLHWSDIICDLLRARANIYLFISISISYYTVGSMSCKSSVNLSTNRRKGIFSADHYRFKPIEILQFHWYEKSWSVKVIKSQMTFCLALYLLHYSECHYHKVHVSSLSLVQRETAGVQWPLSYLWGGHWIILNFLDSIWHRNSNLSSLIRNQKYDTLLAWPRYSKHRLSLLTIIFLAIVC